MDIMEMVSPLIKEIVLTLVLILAGLAANALRRGIVWWRELLIEDWIKDVVEDGVLYAQELLWDKVGQDKYDFALNWIADKLQAKGIDVDPDWIGGLIDAAVKRLREELSETWYPADKG